MRKVIDTKPCESCGLLMIRKTTKGSGKSSPKDWERKKYCSNKCRYKDVKVSGNLNGNWKGGKPRCIDCNTYTSQYGVSRCRKCYILFNRDINHPNYQNGLHKQKYPQEFNAKLKLQIRQRDLFKCQLCYKLESEELEEFNRVLCVNHIDFNKNNCSPSNLNTLCLRCNLLINYDREKWTNYFK